MIKTHQTQDLKYVMHIRLQKDHLLRMYYHTASHWMWENLEHYKTIITAYTEASVVGSNCCSNTTFS